MAICYKCASVYTASKRFCCQKTLENVDTTNLKRGTGGRSSFNGNVVTIFGATGFLGKFICSILGSKGTQLIIPYRCDPSDTSLSSLKLSGDLGQVQFCPFHLKDPWSIRRAIKYSNVVINLIGRNFESSNFNFHQVHVKGAREIAAACKEMNVERFIHFSSLNVTESAQRYYVKKINFLPTKLEGEHAVLEEYPSATIFRPSSIYGYDDQFLWPLCRRSRYSFNSAPLYAKGMKTIKAPVYAPDVAKAVSNAIDDYSTRGKIYQAIGPEKFYLRDISMFCSQVLQRHHFTSDLVHNIKYDLLFFSKVIFYRYLLEAFIYEPVRGLSFEIIERESVSDEIDSNLPTLSDLGVAPKKFEDVVPGLIFKDFKRFPSMTITPETYLPPESLSDKSISDYDLKGF